MVRALACRPSLAAAITAVVVGASAPVARADVFDLSLQRLVTVPTNGGFADLSSDVPAQTAYRTFVSELSAGLAPKMLTTADTVGYNGFQFTVDYSFTTISNNACAAGDTVDKCPWSKAVEGNRNPQGNRTPPPGMLHTLSVYARKGIWLPLPSFEIGAGATKLLQSDIYAVQVYAKFALHEGFHSWPIPSFAVRGSALRVLGASQIDLTMAQVDAELSKSFGLGGTVTLVPYLGAAVLFAIARGQVLDPTPTVDAYKMGQNAPDLNNNAVFPVLPSDDTIIRARFFGGFRLQYHILVLTTDFMITTCGDWDGKTCNHKRHTIADNAANQYTYSVSGGFIF